MSEPPLKKKRTLLDFFTFTGGKKEQTTSKKRKTMATASGDESANGAANDTAGAGKLDAEVAGPSLQVPGPSKVAGTSKVAGPSKVSGPSSQGEDPTFIPESDYSDTEKSDITEQSSGSQSLDGSEHQIPTKKPSQLKADSKAWKGIPVKTLDKLTDVNEDLGPLQGTDQHRVLFKTPFVYDDKKPPSPFPQYKDKWDAYHVRMPCSNQNEYPTQNKDGAPTVQRRWDMIQEALLGPIPGPYELEEKILSYNSRYYGKWNFDVLHRFFIEHIHDQEKTHFFGHTLKKMANLALQLPHLCTAPIPLLKSGRNFSITLSQQQIACLLANAFFCTFPRRNAKSAKSEFCRYPTINFNTLFMGQPSFVKFEKLKCIIHYFNRIFKKMPCGTVTFMRQCVDLLPDWDNDGTQLKGLHVSSEGTIEDDGYGMLQVDFANSFLGGGVLGNGCVQEEIRFLICPEMLVTRLFTECLGHNECLIMRGCERFSNYDGYASKFEWKQDYEDKTPRDSWGRIKCEVVAIDALQFYDFKSQFTQKMVKRELNKAYVGFTHLGKKTGQLPAVCTGNWGCGAFGGDKQLKALIQLMAAARAGRDLCYFTFDDEKLRDQIFEIHKFLTSEQLLSNGDLMWLIVQYYSDIVIRSARGPIKLHIFDYIMNNKIKRRETYHVNTGSSSHRGKANFSHTFPGPGQRLGHSSHHNRQSQNYTNQKWNQF